MTFTEERERYVDVTLVPNFRALGPRLGKRLPLVKKALQKVDGTALFRELKANGSVRIPVEGGDVELGREELEVRLGAREGFAAAAA